MVDVVTGVGGFIGSTLAERLLAQGSQVIGIDSLTDYYDPALKRSNLVSILKHPRFTFLECDLLQLPIQSLPEDTEVIYHQAGRPGVRGSWGAEFAKYTEENVLVTQMLLERAKTLHHLQRFVYASSSSVYGNAAKYPTTEEDATRPHSPYGVTKLAGEHLCSLYGRNFGVPTVSLRYFTVYGPRQRPDMAFTKFIKLGLAGEELIINGDGSQLRDFTYVDDVVSANLLVAGSGFVSAGSVFNVAGGRTVSLNYALESIEHSIGSSLSLRHGEPLPGDVQETGGDISRISDLGWTPRTSIRDGIAAQVEWLRHELTTKSHP